MNALLKKGKRQLAVLTGSLFFMAGANAQDSAIANQFIRYQQNALQEKVFVHTDKELYVAGELMWFKMYNVDANFNRPFDLSKVDYIELLDRNNKPVLQGKISMKAGTGSGSFYLPVNLNSGNYKLRTYTSWMKNSGPDYFFEKMITVLNSQETAEWPAESKHDPLTVRFFPEGGNLVNGLSSVLAFKAVGADGKGVDCKGVIVSDAHDTVVRFQSLQFGMGHFNFTPAEGHNYQALLTTTANYSVTVSIPEVYKQGYVLSVSNAENNQLSVKVQTNIATSGQVFLLVHTRQSVNVAADGNMKNGQVSFLIDKNKLGDGISHFTVFNNNKQPVCERLVFTYPRKKLQIEASADQTDYDIRKKISVRIKTTDENAGLQAADMSMAVYRIDGLQSMPETDISSYLWLSADIKGAIESPSSYFEHAQNREEAMDNLMLTQGWRRFRWEDLLANKKPLLNYLPEFGGHIITGKVVNAKTGALGRNINTFLSVPSTRTQFSNSLSDSNAVVEFEMKDMFGGSGVILQTYPTDSVYRIDIDNPFSEKYSDNQLPFFRLNRNIAGPLLEQSISMQVQNIYGIDKLRQYEALSIDTTAFYGKPSASYLLDKYTRFTTMEEVLREYVVLLLVKKRNGNYHLPVYDDPNKRMFDNDPLTLVDGVPLFDLNRLISYDPLKVRKLDVVNGHYFYGASVYSGILNFTTYDGNLTGFDMDPHAVVVDYEGLQLQREFYSPVYDTEKKQSSHIPDFRNVLYWSANIKTNETGNQLISFYSSDLAGKYAVVLQGITKDGKSGSATIMLNVKE